MNTYNRRMWIQHMIHYGAFLPFLPSLLKSEKLPSQPRKRFIALFFANGQNVEQWYPQNFQNFDEITPQYKSLDLQNVSGPISKIIGSEFDGLRHKINILRGMDLTDEKLADHTPIKMLSTQGRDYGADHLTIDQIIARSKSVYSAAPRLRSLHLQVPGLAEESIQSIPLSVQENQGVLSRMPQIENPQVAFDFLFSRISGRRRNFDFVLQEFSKFSKNPQLSKADKIRIESHSAMLEELSHMITNHQDMTTQCQTQSPEIPAYTRDVLTPLHLKILSSAIKCGITNVATMMLSSGADSHQYQFLNLPGSGNFHGLSHSHNVAYSMSNLNRIRKWTAQEISNFLKDLDTVEDSQTGETFLDNSIVFWGSDTHVTVDPSTPHEYIGMPVFLAGSGGGNIRTGRYIDYRQEGIYHKVGNRERTNCDYIGRPYNELLISIMLALGLQPREWEKEEAGFGTYANSQQYHHGDKRSPLPGLLNL